MSLTSYDFTVRAFIKTLEALGHILEKGKEYADSKKIDFSILLQTRLTPDQFPLAKQIQIATDVSKLFVPRISSLEAPSFPDTEATYEEFQERIQKTVAYLQTISSSDIQPEGKKVTFRWNPGMFLDGENYVVEYAIPNFYFHVSMAYAILRASGVPLGKSDYLYNISWQTQSE